MAGTSPFRKWPERKDVMLMDEGASQATIAAYLYVIATEHMGLSATDKRRCDHVASLLVSMRPEFEAHRCEVAPRLTDDDDGIVIGDGRSYVRLKLVGRSGLARQPTHVEVRIGAFTVCWEKGNSCQKCAKSQAVTLRLYKRTPRQKSLPRLTIVAAQPTSTERRATVFEH
jgi:hypothetical protein